MNAVWTSGKRKNTNYKLNNIKLYCEPSELILISSLSDLKREENLEKFNHLSSYDFSSKVGINGDCHLFNAVLSDKDKFYKYYSDLNEEEILQKIKDDEKKNYIERHVPSGNHKYNYIYLFDNDQDGMMPNIHKVLKKSNKQEIGFFVNPSNVATSDFIDEAIQFLGNHRPFDGKLFKIKNNDLVFCCIPGNENVTKKFSSNIELFIKDRIKKKKLIKFKVPNGVYGIYNIVNIPIIFKNLSEFSEPHELLGHYIKRFNPKIGTIGWEERKKKLKKRRLKK